jgi:TolB-like protein/DNA-binding winged helix-turn-helix (wHTH) protein/cytochrome c-type biogenesis protein CcmH/NrfG
MDAPATADVFVFEDFRLDRCGLSRQDRSGAFVPIAIGSRALDVLHTLVERSGDLVARDEILQAVWPGMVVESSNLPVQIATLRRVLDEGRADGSCIQTIPSRGYRFALAVTRVEPCARPAPGRTPGNGATAPFAEPKPLPPNRSANRQPIRQWRERGRLWGGSLGLVAGALCLLAVVAIASNWRGPQSGLVRPALRLSIVVLPFTDLGDDRDRGHFADAMTENLTTELSLRSDIRVTSPNTAFTYGKRLVDTTRIGRELGVRYVLEGSVQRSGSRLRVNAELIDAETDRQVWAARFDRDADDLFALQNEIASQLANALGVELVAAEATRTTDHPDALGYILRGRAERLKPNSPESYAQAIHLFEHALALDPKSVEAQTWLAASLATRVLDRMSASPPTDIARADELVSGVLAASPRYAPAHLVKGTVLRVQDRYTEAIPEYETVLAINPNDTAALHALAQCKLMIGLIDEVIPLEEQAIRLNPRDPHIGFKYARIGMVQLLQSRTDAAIPLLERAASGEPEYFMGHAGLAAAFGLKGETTRAARELAETRRLLGTVGRDSYSTTARLRAISYWGVPKIHALWEATFLPGLRKAGVPEE